MYQKLLLIFILLVFASCQTLWINSKTYHRSKNEIQLASIGVSGNDLLNADFKTTALPEYKQGLKLQLSFYEFGKASYRAYQKSCLQQGKVPSFQYVDSVSPHPQFVGLKFLDEVTIIEQLETTENQSIIKHLQQNPNSKIISTLYLFWDVENIHALQQAEEVFLVNNTYKTYQLALYQKGKLTQHISLSQGIPFAYEASGFCWIQTNTKKWVLSGLLQKNEICPANQYSTFQKAKKTEKKLKW